MKTMQTIIVLALLLLLLVIGQVAADVDFEEAKLPLDSSSLIAELSEDFDWDGKFDTTFPDAKLIYENEDVDPTELEEFPKIVDVALVANCKAVPEGLPVEFVFKKVMQRFDAEKPGMYDLEPGDKTILDDEDYDEDKYYYDDEEEDEDEDDEEDDEEEWDGRQLRGTEEASASASASRNLKFKVCPKCKKAKKWKICLKNKCKSTINRIKRKGGGRSRRIRRELKRHNGRGNQNHPVWTPKFKGLFGGWKKWDKKDEAESEMKKESMQKEASNLRGSARQVHALAVDYKHTNSEYASLLQDKANLMLASAELNDQMADLLEVNILTSRQNAFLVKNSDKSHKLEMAWANAMEMTGVTACEEVKSVGKLEHDLNKVVAWFTKYHGCQLGVVVEKIA